VEVCGIYEVVMVIAASFISNSIMISYVFLSQTPVPRSIFLICILTDIALIGEYGLLTGCLEELSKGNDSFYKFKEGADCRRGDAGAIIVKEMKSHPELKSTPVAFVDDDKYK